ncbi:DUF4231 domain-containing protein [Streptomyces sp. bgisy126]|uniref:DUF4231 domain-containing protein n=1 Tax=unclassified Streptomyces TaxID=2593676 RepID=UPI003EBE6D61
MEAVRTSQFTSNIWAQQASWSLAANRQKRRIGRVRAVSLFCFVIAAVLGTAAAQIGPAHPTAAQWSAFGAAVAVGVVTVLNSRVGQGQIQEWTRLRSVSEAFKGEVYACLAGVGSYRTPRAVTVLRDAVNGIRAEAADLLHHIVDLPVDPSRPLPAVDGVDSYVRVRVQGQIDDYYRPRALWMHRRLRVVRRTEVLLGSAAVLLGAGSGAFQVEAAAAWVAVISTVSATVVAYAAAAKYEYQELEFLRTADELERILADWRLSAHATPEAEDALVGRCEQVISILNDTWMVKWNSEP